MTKNRGNVYTFANEFWKSLRDKHILEKNKCSTCEYSGTITGDAHLSCNHPAIVNDKNTMQRILQNMALVYKKQ